jgi:hypothetical protein
MKRGVLFTLVAGLAFALCLATMSDAHAGPNPPFTGRWETIDLDGSHAQLVIQPNHKYVGHDDGCRLCGVDAAGNPLYRCRVKGSWAAEGNTITFDLQLWCLNPERTHVEGTEVREYDPATETLVEGDLIWERNPGN